MVLICCTAGAVMFRGFKVSEAIEFERAVRQIEPELSKEYRGTSPRKQVAGTEVSCYTQNTTH